MEMIADFILRVSLMAPGFLLAISFHEYAHACAANRFGDPTAKSMGRLTLNPGAHYDLFGTIILPSPLLPSIWGFLVTQNQFLSTLATSRIIENRFFGLALPPNCEHYFDDSLWILPPY